VFKDDGMWGEFSPPIVGGGGLSCVNETYAQAACQKKWGGNDEEGKRGRLGGGEGFEGIGEEVGGLDDAGGGVVGGGVDDSAVVAVDGPHADVVYPRSGVGEVEKGGSVGHGEDFTDVVVLADHRRKSDAGVGKDGADFIVNGGGRGDRDGGFGFVFDFRGAEVHRHGVDGADGESVGGGVFEEGKSFGIEAGGVGGERVGDLQTGIGNLQGGEGGVAKLVAGSVAQGVALDIEIEPGGVVGGDDSLVLGFESGEGGGGICEFGAVSAAEGEDDIAAGSAKSVDLGEVSGPCGGGTIVAPHGFVGGTREDEGERVVGLAGGGFEGGEFAFEVFTGIDFEIGGEDFGREGGLGAGGGEWDDEE